MAAADAASEQVTVRSCARIWCSYSREVCGQLFVIVCMSDIFHLMFISRICDRCLLSVVFSVRLGVWNANVHLECLHVSPHLNFVQNHMTVIDF